MLVTGLHQITEAEIRVLEVLESPIGDLSNRWSAIWNDQNVTIKGYTSADCATHGQKV
jgi:hypothetical protein